jgi:DNA mismatch repair protein MutS2
VYGVVTTHYSQLKAYAFDTKGIVNGAMLFDKELLTPTYRLKVGKPGSSYAFEVAKKVGLSHHVLKYARKKVGKKENLVEDLLVDLQEGKSILDEQLRYIADEKLRLDRLIKNYQEMTKQYDVKRKKLKIKNKEIELKRANNEQVELQKLINKLEKDKNLERARSLKENARSKRQVESSDIIMLKKDILEKKDPDEEIFVGDNIRMIDGDMTGEVLRINGDRVVALFGLMQMEVAMADVILAKDQLAINRTKHINFKGVAFENNFSPKLDIRGYKMRDADVTLDEFFDKALLNNVGTLEIVHGKGSGALRRLVINKMKEYNDFQSYYHPESERGGDGVTFIKV